MWNRKQDVAHFNELSSKSATKDKRLTDYAFPKAGTYFIKGILRLTKNGAQAITEIESEPIQITIVEPIALDLIGSEWSNRGSDKDFHALSSNLLTEWDVTRKLAQARRILDEAFSSELGEDDMDELEREFQDRTDYSITLWD